MGEPRRPKTKGRGTVNSNILRVQAEVKGKQGRRRSGPNGELKGKAMLPLRGGWVVKSSEQGFGVGEKKGDQREQILRRIN